MSRSLYVCALLLFNFLNGWDKPGNVPEDVWEQVMPYLLPDDHPTKKILKEILLKVDFRIVENEAALLRGRYKVTGTSHTQNFYVVKHKKLKGWLLKVYTDDNPEIEWPRFVHRCRGVQAANEAIQGHNASRYFKTPRKYIIPLYQCVSPINAAVRKDFVLLVEDMKILSKDKSRALWSSRSAKPDLLDHFWAVVTTGGLSDSFYIDNCPWCEDGKIAFVDLEQYHKWPIYYPRMLEHLSHGMKHHWMVLMNNHGIKY